ncbi:hypothetical protein ACJX0J_019520, partial [Zea mays]
DVRGPEWSTMFFLYTVVTHISHFLGELHYRLLAVLCIGHTNLAYGSLQPLKLLVLQLDHVGLSIGINYNYKDSHIHFLCWIICFFILKSCYIRFFLMWLNIHLEFSHNTSQRAYFFFLSLFACIGSFLIAPHNISGHN